jgi:hypothetical protein
MVIWYILLAFGLFSPFWYVLPRKIWQPCVRLTVSNHGLVDSENIGNKKIILFSLHPNGDWNAWSPVIEADDHCRCVTLPCQGKHRRDLLLQPTPCLQNSHLLANQWEFFLTIRSRSYQQQALFRYRNEKILIFRYLVWIAACCLS